MTSSRQYLTQLLIKWSEGDQAALDDLLPLINSELRRMARNYMRREKTGHTLQPTALVNEVYLRLIDQQNIEWQNRAQFFGVAAQLMRRILVDHARRYAFAKRGGGALRVSFGAAIAVPAGQSEDVLALHEALEKLTEMDARKGRIVELRSFGGLTLEEIAEVLSVSLTTVQRDWRAAKAWLHYILTEGDDDDA